MAYYKDAKNNLSGEKTCQMFMSTIIEVIRDRNNTIKNDVINLEAMDQMYENNTEKMLKEVMPGKSSGKSLHKVPFYLVSCLYIWTF